MRATNGKVARTYRARTPALMHTSSGTLPCRIGLLARGGGARSWPQTLNRPKPFQRSAVSPEESPLPPRLEPASPRRGLGILTSWAEADVSIGDPGADPRWMHHMNGEVVDDITVLLALLGCADASAGHSFLRRCLRSQHASSAWGHCSFLWRRFGQLVGSFCSYAL